MHGHIPCPTEKKTKTGIVGTVFKVRLPSAIEVPIEPRPTPRFFYYFCDNSRDPMENETTFLLTRYSLRETTVSNKGRCIFETETKESTTGFGTTVTIKRYSFGASWFLLLYCRLQPLERLCGAWNHHNRQKIRPPSPSGQNLRRSSGPL